MSDTFVKIFLVFLAICIVAFVVFVTFPTSTRIAVNAVRTDNIAKLRDVLPRIDINSRFETGQGTKNATLLHVAAKESSIETIAFLLQNGASPELQDELGRTPLHISLGYRDDESSEINVLLSKQMDSLDVQDERQRSPLFLAAGLDLKQFGEFLIDNGANVDLRNYRSQTSLHRCIISKNWEFANMLLEKGADPLVSDENNKTPFEYATESELSQKLRQSLRGE